MGVTEIDNLSIKNIVGLKGGQISNLPVSQMVSGNFILPSGSIVIHLDPNADTISGFEGGGVGQTFTLINTGLSNIVILDSINTNVRGDNDLTLQHNEGCLAHVVSSGIYSIW